MKMLPRKIVNLVTEMNRKNFVTQLFRCLFFASALILSLMSILALITVHAVLLGCSQCRFSFNPMGINNYISAFEPYKALFAGTVTTIAAYYGLRRFQIAADQNKDKLKYNRFIEWQTVLVFYYKMVVQNDKFMIKIFIKVRSDLFDQLYPIDFKIEGQDKLEEIFDKVFKKYPISFEKQNKKFIESGGGKSPDGNHSYSLESFETLFLGCVNYIYDGGLAELGKMYLKAIDSERETDNVSPQ